MLPPVREGEKLNKNSPHRSTKKTKLDTFALLVICLAAGGVILAIFIVCGVCLYFKAERRISRIDQNLRETLENTHQMTEKTTKMVADAQICNKDGIDR